MTSWLFHAPAFKRSHPKLELINSHLLVFNLAFSVTKCHPVFILALFRFSCFLCMGNVMALVYVALSSAAFLNELLSPVPWS